MQGQLPKKLENGPITLAVLLIAGMVVALVIAVLL